MSKGVLKLNGNELVEILNDTLGGKNLSIDVDKLVKLDNGDKQEIEFLAGDIIQLELRVSYRKLKD